MAQPQIVLLNDEGGYQRDVAKFIDPTLTDDDILSVEIADPNEMNNIVPELYGQYIAPFPIFATPYGGDTLRGSDIRLSDPVYPDMLICRPLYPYPGYPSPFPLTSNFNIIMGMTTVECGSGESGISQWLRSNAMEFVESSFGFSGSDFTVTNVTKPNGTTARLFLTTLSYFVGKERVFISGITGFSSNPSGWYSITNVDPSGTWLEITHNLGTGAYASGGLLQITFLSNTPTVTACKLNLIRKGRIAANGSCSWWEARYVARKTGTYSGTKDSLHGYGKINVASAIAYSGSVDPDDDYTTLGSVGTLTSTYNATTGSMVFKMPLVANAQNYILVRDSGTPNAQVIYSTSIYAGVYDYPFALYITKTYPRIELVDIYTKIEFTHLPVLLGSHTYKYYATRGSTETALSNAVTSSITEPIIKGDFRFALGQYVYFTGIDGTIRAGKITERKRSVDYSRGDNVGIVTDMYTLEGGLALPEYRLGITMNHLLWKIKGKLPLNPDDGGNALNQIPTDICGFEFIGCDMTNVDITDKYVDGCKFIDCTWGTNLNTAAKFKTVMAGLYDPSTTFYNDTPIGDIA